MTPIVQYNRRKFNRMDYNQQKVYMAKVNTLAPRYYLNMKYGIDRCTKVCKRVFDYAGTLGIEDVTEHEDNVQ